MCVTDVACLFEKNHIIQPLRIWYWLLYFLLGAWTRQNQERFRRINWDYALIACICFVIFGKYVKAGGNEYLFGSIPCIAYAFITFMACVNTKITDSKVIAELSQCFLPVYAIHNILLGIFFSHQPMPMIESTFCPQIAIAIQYLIVSTIIVSISLVLMHTKYIKSLFRI